jgi:hypothetical protein
LIGDARSEGIFARLEDEAQWRSDYRKGYDEFPFEVGVCEVGAVPCTHRRGHEATDGDDQQGVARRWR